MENVKYSVNSFSRTTQSAFALSINSAVSLLHIIFHSHDKTSKHEFIPDFPGQTMLCEVLKGVDMKGNIPKDPQC